MSPKLFEKKAKERIKRKKEKKIIKKKPKRRNEKPVLESQELQ